jgi:hypothetical protein
MGLECAKAIWLKFNKPEDLPEVDEALQHRFDEGHMVGNLAKSLFPNGIDIREVIPKENDKRSRELLKTRKPLFEAGFLHRNRKCYARADIMVPASGGRWDILEVKSSTHVKDYHLHDVSFQRYCYESAGLRIRKCFVVHVNKDYVRHASIDPHAFFVRADVTESVAELIPGVPSRIRSLFHVINRRSCPEFGHGEEFHRDDTGIHANDRFWKAHPDSDIMDLYWGGKNSIELFNSGILRLSDIPSSYDLSPKQLIQQESHRNNTHHVDRPQLASFLQRLVYPLCFLDFESYQTAIPLYDGLRPYQQIPFQFSLHILNGKDAKPTHHSFMATGSGDPRPAFIHALKRALGAKGSIVVYNQAFEQAVLRELAGALPEYAPWVNATVARMVDLLIPFKSFAYYHPLQKGSASLKRVLPALTGITYEGFEIANGSDASLSYLFMTHGSYEGKKPTASGARKIRSELEKYCGQDTMGMVKVVERLEHLVHT